METTQLVALFFLSGEDVLRGPDLSYYTEKFKMAYKRDHFADIFNADATFELVDLGHQGKAPFESTKDIIIESGFRVTIIAKTEMNDEDAEVWIKKITEFLTGFGDKICVYNILISTCKVKRNYIVLKE